MENDNKKENILYVDDEKHNLEVFASAFRRYYNVLTASSAAEAIEILNKHPIALIITDQRMPDMTGVQLLEKIIPEFPDPVRILLSGFSDVDVVIEAINDARIFRYISKPWDEKELKQSIDVGLQIYQLEKKAREKIYQMQENSLKHQRVLSLFQKYVPEQVVNDALSNTSNLFGGESRMLSVLFMTIKNLNDITTRINPQEMFVFLNTYFSRMSHCIEEHKGVVDKFIGGSLLALFGAPIPSTETQKNATFAGLHLLDELEKFNQEYSATSPFQVEVSIGINFGDAVVGNIGSQQYISYTVIGDTVNTASRLADIALQQSPNTILISDSVFQEIKKDIVAELLGQKEIHGKEQLVSIYKVSGKK